MMSNRSCYLSRHRENLLTADQLQTRIKEMAVEINEDHPDGESLHFVAVLKGACLSPPTSRVRWPRASHAGLHCSLQYGAATKSSGEVRLLKDLDTPLQGRDVIIVEDS